MNKIGPAGRSALAEACRADNVKMVQAVVNQGGDVEQPNPFYKDATPVVVAVIHKNPKVVHYLIEVSIRRPFNVYVSFNSVRPNYSAGAGSLSGVII